MLWIKYKFLLSIFSKGKEAISRLVQKFRNAGPSPSYSGGSDEGPGMLELLVSGGKVGLIIGKGGETIKMLMVSYMFVILRLITYISYSFLEVTTSCVGSESLFMHTC